MQLDVENAVSRFPQVAVVFTKSGTAETGSDPMPPNISDTYIMLKPQADGLIPPFPKPISSRRLKPLCASYPATIMNSLSRFR